MSVLRVNKIAASGQTSENTGSVFFDGTGDYLTIATHASDFNFGTGDFTIEFWINSTQTSRADPFAWNFGYTLAGWGSFILNTSSGRIDWYEGTGIATYATSTGWNDGLWHHLAVSRSGTSLKVFLDGVQIGTTASSSYSYGASDVGVSVGFSTSTGYYLNGYISNLRIIKGKALYTSNFAPPTTELEVTPETVLVACHDGEDIFAEKTGKIIAAYGDRLSSPTPTATDSPIGITTFQPGLTRSVDVTAGPVLQGSLEYNSQNFLVLPKGTTEQREAPLAGNRGIFSIGRATPAVSSNSIDYITITSTGNAQDFGDDIITDRARGACSSYTRAIFAGAYLASPSVNNNVISYVTIQSTGNALDFGDTTTGDSRFHIGSLSNSTRGLFFNGVTPSPGINTIDYVHIATTGNAVDFGDTQLTSGNPKGCSSPTRGIMGSFANSPASASTDNIQFVTISTLGDASSFGDLSTPRKSTATCSSATRGVFAGGYGVAPTASTRQTIIDFITISSTGTASSFGDLIQAFSDGAGTSNSIRGIFAGGTQSPATPAQPNVIQYITIATTGGSTDFGDLTYERANVDGCSNGHGGLG